MPERDLWSFYDEIRDFQLLLSGHGHAEAAEALDRAMHGATSGEILGSLGVALAMIETTVPGESARARDLLTYLDGWVPYSSEPPRPKSLWQRLLDATVTRASSRDG